MESANHAHGAEQIDIKHSLYSGNVCVNGCHRVSYATGMGSMSLISLDGGLYIRAVHKNIKTSAGQLLHRCLEVTDGLLNRNI